MLRRTPARGIGQFLCVLLTLGISILVENPARADFIVLTDPSQFESGSTLITFDEGDFDGHRLQPFDVVTSYRGVLFQALGAPLNTWPQVGSDPTPPREFGPGGSAGANILNVFPPPLPVEGLELTLPYPVTQFGAEFEATNPGDFAFTLFDGGRQVDFITIPAGPTGFFYRFHAFEDASAFDRVIIQGPGFDASNGSIVLDNLRFSPVPEPGTLALLAVPIMLLGEVARRHRRHS